jgi:hypothetical protein
MVLTRVTGLSGLSGRVRHARAKGLRAACVEGLRAA